MSGWYDRWPQWADVEWERLAAEHGTPFYLFDADVVVQRIRAVREAMRGAKVYYAVKANPNLALLRAASRVADGADISSAGELEQARLAGFDPAAMSFAGPAKTASELEAAIRAGVGCISAESPREIEVCAHIAQQLGTKANLLMRVNPSQASRAYGVKMGGRAVQFGIEEEELPQAEALLLAHRAHVEFRGVHVYVGSQCFDAAAVAETTRNALRIADEVEKRTGLRCVKVNLGGGFGVSHAEERRELDLMALGAEVAPTLPSTPDREAIFELGRFLTSDAGIYVTRVVSAKTSRGKSFVGCDGGLNHHLAAAGTFGAALRGNYPLVNLSRPDAEPVTCSVAGPSCNPTDLLGVDVRLPRPAEGDLVGVAMAGSYGLTASPLLFLGHATPVELVRAQGVVVVGRRRHAITDFN